MILKALGDYHRALGAAGEAIGFMEKGLSWAVNLDSRGRFIAMEDLRVVKGPASAHKIPGRRVVPATLTAESRTTNLTPYPLADSTEYSLGWSGKGRSAARFETFKALTRRLREALPSEECLAALMAFLEADPDPRPWPQWPEMAETICAFRLAGQEELMHERPAFRAYWGERWWDYNKSGQEGAGKSRLQSCVSGEMVVLTSGHRPTRAGIPGALGVGARLVSHAKPAFNFNALKDVENAPMSAAEALAFSKALDYLLNPENGHALKLAGGVALYWLDEPADREKVFRYLINPVRPDVVEASAGQKKYLEEARSILIAMRDGSYQPAGFNLAAKINLLGLSGNMGRLAVRFWISQTVGEFFESLGRHTLQTRLDRRLENPEFLGTWHWREALGPNRRPGADSGDEAPANLMGGLFYAIFKGEPYPRPVYDRLLQLFREPGQDKRHRHFRAALITGVLNRNFGLEVKPMLDEERRDPAFLCGRLFAVMQHMYEERGYNPLKSPIMAQASIRPAAFFPKLAVAARATLECKYSSDKPHRPQLFYKKLLDDLTSLLGAGFPARLGEKEQGLFVIGYHQQRSEFFKKRPAADEGA